MQLPQSEPPIDAVLPSDIFDDIKIACTQMTTWTEPGELNVAMLQGDVSLEMGGRTAMHTQLIRKYTK